MSEDADWWRGAVIYQIYPRSFQDSTGDGTGDLEGIVERLPYVADLGVDAIWLSPVFKSPMADMGYDIADYTDVDPIFGTIDDFDRLVERAHGLGLKVMIDQVFSHSSDKHPWFVESKSSRENPKADWYVWVDPKPEGSPPNNWQSVFGGSAWQWNPKRKQYYMHNFLASQPDLNFWHEPVQEAVLAYLRFWLNRGVDGFRLDSINYCFHDPELRDNPPVTDWSTNDVPDNNAYGYQQHLYDKTRPEMIPFLRRVRALLDEYDARTTVGEVGDGARSLKTMAEYTSGTDKLHMAYSFDMLGPNFSVAHFRGCAEAFDRASAEYGQGDSWPCWAFSNHDVPRHVSRWAHHDTDPVRLAKFTAALLLALRGSVCIYQGEELGLPEAELAYEDLTDPYGIAFWPEFKGRDGCRTPMPWTAADPRGGFTTSHKPWLPVPAEHVAAAVDTQAGRAGSVLEFYRAMIAFRRAHPALVKGSKTFLDWSDTGLAFLREGEGERLLCLFNLADTAQDFALPQAMAPVEIGPERAPAETPATGRVTLSPLGVFFGRLAD